MYGGSTVETLLAGNSARTSRISLRSKTERTMVLANNEMREGEVTERKEAGRKVKKASART